MRFLEIRYEIIRTLCRTSPAFVVCTVVLTLLFLAMAITGLVLGAKPEIGFEVSWPLLIIPALFVIGAISLVCFILIFRKCRLQQNPQRIRVAPAPNVPNPMMTPPTGSAKDQEIITIVEQ